MEDALQAQFLHPGDLEDARFARRVFAHYEETRERRRKFPGWRFAEVRERLLDLERRIRLPEHGDERAYRKAAMRNILNDLITSVSLEKPARAAVARIFPGA